jgi:FixJ family two-component response regulator
LNDKPTVFVVDDDAAVRNAIGMLLKSVGLQAEIYPSATAFLESYESGQPGCLVLDVRMPGMSGLALQEHFVAQDVQLPIIFITAHGDVSTSVRAMKMDAFDFLEKPFSSQDLLDRINAAISWDARNRVRRGERAEIADRAASLTPREKEILSRIVEGNSNKVIARELDISPKTVEFHRKRIMEKMQADSLAALVRMSLLIGQRPS